MASPTFLHGKNTRVFFANPSTPSSYDISQFFNDVSTSFAGAADETTTFSNGGVKTYILGLREGSISLSGFYDGTTAGVDAILNAAISNTNDEGMVVFPDGATAASTVARAHLAKTLNSSYNLKSPVSGVVAVDTNVQCDSGIWQGHGSIASPSGVGTTTTTVSDKGFTTNNGGLVVMGVTAIAGTSPTVTLTVQHSTDNSTWQTLATSGSQSGLYGYASTVSGVSGSIYRYTRLQVVLGGTSPSATVYFGLARY